MNTLDKAIYEYHNSLDKTIQEILTEYGLSSYTFYKKLDYKEPKRYKKKARQYSFNINKIKEDSREKYYWLGFLAADGYIGKTEVRLELKRTDKKHLFKFLKFLESDAPIKDFQHPKSQSSYISISSVELINYLKEYNLIPNKSLVYTIPLDKIPDKFKLDFVRGMIDGDGCIRVNNHQQISLKFSSGNEICINQIKNILGIENKVSYSSGCFNFQVTGNKKAKAILDKIYEYSTELTRLDRKYDIYYTKFYRNGEK